MENMSHYLPCVWGCSGCSSPPGPQPAEPYTYFIQNGVRQYAESLLGRGAEPCHFRQLPCPPGLPDRASSSPTPPPRGLWAPTSPEMEQGAPHHPQLHPQGPSGLNPLSFRLSHPSHRAASPPRCRPPTPPQVGAPRRGGAARYLRAATGGRGLRGRGAGLRGGRRPMGAGGGTPRPARAALKAAPRAVSGRRAAGARRGGHGRAQRRCGERAARQEGAAAAAAAPAEPGGEVHQGELGRGRF